MPVEVISLLSSPQAEPPRNLLPSSPLFQATSPEVRNVAPARMAAPAVPYSLIPSLSSSPLRQAVTKPPQQQENAVIILSDDLDDDLNDSFINSGRPDHNAVEPACKRPRLSDQAIQSPPKQRNISTGSRAPLTQTQQLGPRRNLALEPIDLSSSPFPATPAAFHGRPNEFDRNPFASSSPPRPEVRALPKDWDPISSSAPEVCEERPVQTSRQQFRRVQSEVTTPRETIADPRHASSDDEFPDISRLPLVRPNFGAKARQPLARVQANEPSRVKAPAKKTAEDKERAQAEREAKKAEREAEKQRKQREKEQARKDKAAEKERAAAIAEVNKLRTDKKVSTPEMIVNLPVGLASATKLQAETLLKDLDVQSTVTSTPVDNVVRWRRKVRARYNDEVGQWEPIPERIEMEKYAMAVLPAAELVQLATGDEGANLEAHVLSMQRHFAEYTLIYMIQGYNTWSRANRTVRNRQFVSAVREGLDSEEPPSSQSGTGRRRAKAQKDYVDEDRIEDALLELQVVHGAFIHHTNTAVETAQWIAIFTQHISTVPYRRQREQTNAEAAAFCMETGQVRSGDGPRDTYVRMLQEIARVTAPVAYGIATEFPTVNKLVQGLEKGGPLALENVRKSANKDGAFSDRTLGQALSKRLYKIFTGQDELSLDV